MPRGEIPGPLLSEVRRIVTRFAIERVAAGWNPTDLARHSGVHASNIHRVENGETVPTLPVLIRMGQTVGLRLDWVPEHLQPLLALDEFEVKALIDSAGSGCGYMDCGSDLEPALVSALIKLGRFGRVGG